MLAALFIPKTADEATVDSIIKTGTKYGMVLCAPKNYSPAREFACTLFPPERIPAGWRPLIVRVRTPCNATVQDAPCAA